MSPAVSGDKTGWEIARIVLKSSISFKKKQGFPTRLHEHSHVQKAGMAWVHTIDNEAGPKRSKHSEVKKNAGALRVPASC